MKKKDVKQSEKPEIYTPRTSFQQFVKDVIDVDETFTLQHKKQKKFNKFVNNVPLYEGYNIMVDLLMLPETPSKHRYLLTALDLALNTCDFEPLKTKTAKECLKGLKAIFAREYVKKPEYTLSSDNGGEFKAEFDDYLKDNEIYHKFAQPYRHSQNAPIEALNKQLGRIINGYINNVELKTQKPFSDWVPLLDKIRKPLNDRRKRNLQKLRDERPFFNDQVKPEYEIGEHVHFKLDRPYSALNKPQSTTNFREGDMIYSPTIHKIVKILTFNDQPYYRYVLSHKPKVSYSSEQLMRATREVETFLVKQIWGKKKVKGTVYYLVWWKGYLKKDSTWEKQSTLEEDGLNDEIEEYNATD